MSKTLQKTLQLLFLTVVALPFALSAEDKPLSREASPEMSRESGKKMPPELTAAELHQVERFSDLYGELGQQMAEAQTRLKVIQEMQQKLMADFNGFQSAVVEARGYKAGEAVLDLRQRKVTQVSPKSEGPAGPVSTPAPSK